MSARALYPQAKAFHSAEDYAPEEFYSGERICPPSARGGGNAMLRAYLFIFAAIAGVWALLDNHATWHGWPPAAVSAMFSSFTDRAAAPAAPAAAAMAPAASMPRVEPATNAAALDPSQSNLQPLASSDVADAPGAAAKSTAPEATTPENASAGDEAQAPHETAQASPYRRRAEAVGLNPDLSPALLARLSETDYRNAGVAISTAVAKTPDTGVFVWPLRRKPELALFWVHFVPGAAPDCRRYVVTVIKDRWSTTALPMEKCGVKPVPQAGKQASIE